MKNFNYFLVFVLMFLIGGVSYVSNVESYSCPSKTTASYRFITFVGKAGLGGDQKIDAWFEYGTNKNNLKPTKKLTITKDGIYCLRVNKLKPCTTYYYRAGAKNSIGTNYGEIKEIKTLCNSKVPSNNSNNSIKNNNSNSNSWVIF
jgi:hypothetical protein